MKKVLIVDDTKNIRTLLSTCLELEGYDVTSVSDGGQALTLFQNQSFDLAFLDIKLPELSGTEVLRRIRDTGINTPVVIMTAFATVKNAVECTKLGAVAYLQKPFTAEKVRGVLKEIALAGDSDSDKLDAVIQLAKDLMDRDKLDEGYKLLKQALATDPNHSEIYFLIGQIHEKQGNLKDAERFYQVGKQFAD